MPTFEWPVDPAPVTSGLRNNAGDYLFWATWAVDALHYLDDLDQHAERLRWIDLGHHEDTVDLAHARWAASTAMTALDLSAAAVGEHHGVVPVRPDHVHDVADLDQNRGQLCPRLRRLAERRRTRPGYQILKGVRDPLVHRKLGRFIYLNIGGPPPGTDRLGLAVPEAPRQTGEMSSRQVIELSRDTAARHVVALLQAAQAGHVS